MAKSSARPRLVDKRKAGSDDAAGLDVASSRTADVLMDAIVAELKKSGKVTVPRFGTFTVRALRARKDAQAQSAEPVGRTVRFKPSSRLEQAVQGSSADDAVGDALLSGFSTAVARAIDRAHTAGLAVPGREHGTAVERRPDGTVVRLDERLEWTPDGQVSRA